MKHRLSSQKNTENFIIGHSTSQSDFLPGRRVIWREMTVSLGTLDGEGDIWEFHSNKNIEFQRRFQRRVILVRD